MTLSLRDDYREPCPPGAVVASPGQNGLRRGGVDRERVISIDNGALRIAPMVRPGWGKAAVAYGPFDPHAGLTLAVFMLNGHNTSQFEPLPDGLRGRLLRWLRGSEAEATATRLWRWLRVGDKAAMLRRMRAWLHAHTAADSLDENLAIGWFPDATVAAPADQGHGFIMHAGAQRNGDLWAHVRGRLAPVLLGLQNIPVYYVVTLRAGSAIYYAGTVPGAPYLPAFPALRPLAVDPFPETT
ncbi:MAG: hypothetical protein R2851_28250, partial [Caldilineaceae bacterium]